MSLREHNENISDMRNSRSITHNIAFHTTKGSLPSGRDPYVSTRARGRYVGYGANMLDVNLLRSLALILCQKTNVDLAFLRRSDNSKDS